MRFNKQSVMIKHGLPKLYLTFDVEEWTLPEESGLQAPDNKNTKFSKIGSLRLLDLFKEYNIQATFFITGYFAERQPEIVKLLYSAGHEIASHGYENVRLTQHKKDDLKSVILKSTKILSSLVSNDITGFRAPMCFTDSILIELLCDLGYKYDSSIHPAIIPGRYYNRDYPLFPHFLKIFNGDNKYPKQILEIPISVIPLIRFPISWWWMRNIGEWVTYLGANINLARGRDVILYFHPWEYAELPKIKGLPQHLVRGCGRGFLDKLKKFIAVYTNQYKFSCLQELYKEYQGRENEQ